jgi:hypothetical protein
LTWSLARGRSISPTFVGLKVSTGYASRARRMSRPLFPILGSRC